MKAMILAAGRGKRLRPLTLHTPKALLPVAGKPLIQHQVEKLAGAGFRQLVINVAHLGDQIEAALGNGASFGVEIHWSREAQPLETGGGIRQALPLLGKAPFAVVNSDIWTDFPYQGLRALPRPKELAHLILVDAPPGVPGNFSLHPKGRVDHPGQGAMPQLLFTGISVLRPQLFAHAPKRGFPLKLLLMEALAANRLGGTHYQGEWTDAGTLNALDILRQRHPTPAK